MPSPLHYDDEPEQAEDTFGYIDAPCARRPPCQEELAGLARERTNAHGSTPPSIPDRERVGYASRELERLARGLDEQAAGLRAHGEDTAAARLERTARELLALSQAMAASRRA